MKNKEPWYSVLCVFSHPTRVRKAQGNLYEERITLWKAETWNDAYKLAEEEAKEYAKKEDCIFIRACCSYHLFDNNVVDGFQGAEIWSNMRDSHFDADTYINTYCNSGRERDHELQEHE